MAGKPTRCFKNILCFKREDKNINNGWVVFWTVMRLWHDKTESINKGTWF